MINIERAEFQKTIVKMVVEDLVPLSFFSTSDGYKTIAEPIARQLGVSLQRDAVRALVIAKAKAAKDQLKDILCNKAVFLKMDGATRQHTSFVAVSRCKKRVLGILAISNLQTSEIY